MEDKKTTNGVNRRAFIGQAAALSAFLIIPRHVLGGKGFIAPSDQITLGFIGAGRQGHTLQKYFLPTKGSRIVAACDVYKSKAEDLALLTNKYYGQQSDMGIFRACDVYTDFREVLDKKDIDAVVISTPDHWHAAIAVRAAANGKDIYSEKPLSLSVQEGRAMANAVKKYKRIFQTGSMQRSAPEFRQAAELIRNGYLGEIKNIKVSIGGPPIPYNLPKEEVPKDLDWDMWLGPNEYVHYNHELNPVLGDTIWGRWRDFKGLGGGDITDWGAHMFDIVQWSLDMDDSGPVEFTPPNGADIPNLTMKYANGIVMTHENFGKAHAIQFNGSEGVLEIQRRKLVTSNPALATKVMGEKDKRVYKSDNHYEDFLNAIRSRKQPISHIEAGHRSASVCNLANIAFEINKPLKWNPSAERFTNNDQANLLLSRKMKKEWSV
jgi:predicted dehydrogenase